MRAVQTLAATTSAIDWDIYVIDEFNVPRIDLAFDAAPTTAGLITVTKDSSAGAAYDTVIRTYNPVGLTNVPIEGLHGFAKGDKINVAYTNADGVSATGSATVEIQTPYGDLGVQGFTVSNGTIRATTSKYRRYYHMPMTAADPGASGATWVEASASVLSGYQLNAASENIQLTTDIHSDWDTSTDPELEFTFTVNVDNSLGGATDEVDYQVTLYYKGVGETTTRSQVITGSYEVGACDQYTVFKHEVDIDRVVTDNPLHQGDVVNAVLVCLATGDVTDITVNDASISYNITHVGIEEGDI